MAWKMYPGILAERSILVRQEYPDQDTNGQSVDGFGRCQSITFHRFRIEICCIHEIAYLSLYCTGNIIFFVIFTHSIHKFLPLSLIPPHKNHPARRSVRSTPG